MGIRNVDLNSEKWCDLIFENRNKKYGAYYLRKTSSRRRLFALSLVIAGIIFFIILSKTIHFSMVNQIQNYEYEVKAIELSSLFWLEENKIINQVKAEEKSDFEEVVKFTPPVIVEDENIEQNLEDLQEIILSPDSIDSSSEFEEDILLSNKKTVKSNANEEDYDTSTDGMNRSAVFQDGKIELMRYIYQNIQYPSAALKQRIKGKVIYSFIINEDGSISDVTLLQSIYIFLDEEVHRVISSMPLWKPAMEGGKAIKVKYVVPVVFK